MIEQTAAFVGMTAILLLSGWTAATVILGKESAWLRLCLALPMAALTNVVIVCLFTFAGVPLAPLSLLLGHGVIIAARAFVAWKWPTTPASPDSPLSPVSLSRKFIIAFCIVLLGITAVYSLAHAVLLPTFQYDSATNWTMRSQISYMDGAMAFDADESRGMAKPNYPFLFHALQVTVNQGQPQWNDTAANAIHFLLSLGTFGAVWLILRRLRGAFVATIAMTVMLTIPLLGLHLAQGFGDITLVQTLALSAAALCMAVQLRAEQKNPTRWLLVSGGMVAMAVWTKSEGIQAGLLPWLGIVGVLVLSDKAMRRPAGIASIPMLLASGLWVALAFSRGLSLTPHGTDGSIAWHPEALPEVILGLFSRGSFGIAWYVIPAVTAVLFILVSRGSKLVSCRHAIVALWGLFTFGLVLFTYMFTPNVQFLLKAESFYRQMLIPVALLIVSCAAMWIDAPKGHGKE